MIVISENTLFREGLQRLIAAAPDVHVLGAVASLAEAAHLGRETPPDVVIVDQAQDTPAGREVLAHLLDLAVDQVVAVTLNDRAITAYSRRRLREASAQTLLDLLSGDS